MNDDDDDDNNNLFDCVFVVVVVVVVRCFPFNNEQKKIDLSIDIYFNK